MTATDLLAAATSTCRDCGASYPFAGRDEAFVISADGFVRCLVCREAPAPTNHGQQRDMFL